MNIAVENDTEATIAVLHGRLDSGGAAELEGWAIENLSPPTGNVLMDFTNLDYVSSAGLRTILNLSKLLKKSGYTFSLCSVQDHIQEVFEISGFDSFLPVFSSREEYMAQESTT